jgi:hypothetical protein
MGMMHNQTMNEDSGYKHGAKITDPGLGQAYAIAHEFAHVEQDQAPRCKKRTGAKGQRLQFRAAEYRQTRRPTACV